MRELYEKVDKIIDSVDFYKIWKGFSKFTFALYDENYVYFKDTIIPYDRRFLGNTSIEYGGEFIAIWHIDNPQAQEAEILAADIIHEMFHAFQKKYNENRYPSELIMLNYPVSIENFKIKHSENLLLANALLSDDINSKKKLLEKFITARKYRENLIGNTIKQEYYVETAEGIAEYAGCMALKQISPDKYNARINGYIENLRILDERFFHIRRIAYYTGALFCILLSETGANFYHEIGETDTPLFNIFAENSREAKPIIEFDEKLLSAEIEKYLNSKRLKFDSFFHTHNEKISGDFSMCGYDPMNMIKIDNMILCSHFVMLKEKSADEPIFIQGPVVLNMKSGSVYEVESYTK